MSEFVMGPLPEPTDKETYLAVDSILSDCHSLTEVQKNSLKEFDEYRRRQLESDPPRGLRVGFREGWKCPNCGSAHSPSIQTCPLPARI